MMEINRIQSIFNELCYRYYVDPRKFDVVRRISEADTEIVKILPKGDPRWTGYFRIKHIDGVKKEVTLAAQIHGWVLSVAPGELEISFLRQYELMD